MMVRNGISREPPFQNAGVSERRSSAILQGAVRPGSVSCFLEFVYLEIHQPVPVVNGHFHLDEGPYADQACDLCALVVTNVMVENGKVIAPDPHFAELQDGFVSFQHTLDVAADSADGVVPLITHLGDLLSQPGRDTGNRSTRVKDEIAHDFVAHHHRYHQVMTKYPNLGVPLHFRRDVTVLWSIVIRKI